MQRFQRMRSLQTFASIHSSVCNHLNSDRTLSSRAIYKLSRTIAPAERRQLCAA